MFNQKKPLDNELPTPRQLVRSTLVAAAVATVLLFTAVLPGEYGYDPTGIGQLLGLKKMGEIKEKLHHEGKADATAQADSPAPEPTSTPAAPSVASGPERSDSIQVTLAQDEGTEVKLPMQKGAKVVYSWNVAGGVVNHDTHADGKGQSISYAKGRQVSGDSGTLTAAFDGKHGWFWRNRGTAPVTVTLRVRGEHTGMERMK